MLPVTPSWVVLELPVPLVLLDKRETLVVPALLAKRETWVSRVTSAANAHRAGPDQRVIRERADCLEFPERMAHEDRLESADIPESVDTMESTDKLDRLVRRERTVALVFPEQLESLANLLCAI